MVTKKREIGYHINLATDNLESEKKICESPLKRYERKSFLNRTVNGDEKCVHYENPKPKSTKYSCAKSDATYLMGSRRYGTPRVAQSG